MLKAIKRLYDMLFPIMEWTGRWDSGNKEFPGLSKGNRIEIKADSSALFIGVITGSQIVVSYSFIGGSTADNGMITQYACLPLSGDTLTYANFRRIRFSLAGTPSYVEVSPAITSIRVWKV